MNDVCRDDKRPGVTSFLILVDTPLLVKSACLMPRGRYGDFPKFFTILAQKSNREQFM